MLDNFFARTFNHRKLKVTNINTEMRKIITGAINALLLFQSQAEVILVYTIIIILGQICIATDDARQVATAVVISDRKVRHRIVRDAHHIVVLCQMRAAVVAKFRASRKFPSSVGQESVVARANDLLSIAKRQPPRFLECLSLGRHLRLNNSVIVRLRFLNPINLVAHLHVVNLL